MAMALNRANTASTKAVIETDDCADEEHLAESCAQVVCSSSRSADLLHAKDTADATAWVAALASFEHGRRQIQNVNAKST